MIRIPTLGTTVNRGGDTIDVWINTKEELVVPDVTNYTYDQALNAFSAAGILVSGIDYENSDTVGRKSCDPHRSAGRLNSGERTGA